MTWDHYVTAVQCGKGLVDESTAVEAKKIALDLVPFYRDKVNLCWPKIPALDALEPSLSMNMGNSLHVANVRCAKHEALLKVVCASDI